MPFEWEPPNGYPDVGAAWANTNGLLNRWNLASALVLDWFDARDGAGARHRRPLAAPKTSARLVDAMAALSSSGGSIRRTATA